MLSRCGVVPFVKLLDAIFFMKEEEGLAPHVCRQQHPAARIGLVNSLAARLPGF